MGCCAYRRCVLLPGGTCRRSRVSRTKRNPAARGGGGGTGLNGVTGFSEQKTEKVKEAAGKCAVDTFRYPTPTVICMADPPSATLVQLHNRSGARPRPPQGLPHLDGQQEL